MNKKSLAILMRARMRPSNHPTNTPNPSLVTVQNKVNQMPNNSQPNQFDGTISRRYSEDDVPRLNASALSDRSFDAVRESMHSAISLDKTEVLDTVLNNFSEGYLGLSFENQRKLLLLLAKVYDLNRVQVRDLMKQYLGLQLPCSDGEESSTEDEDGMLSYFYRLERNLRHSLRPRYELLFERLNNHPGGLKFLSILRADILSILAEENIASLRALDSYLKEKLNDWLSPAALELHHITWNDPASLLEKIVAYEAVHPISNLLDLKRRLGYGRRCFGYLHPAIPG